MRWLLGVAVPLLLMLPSVLVISDEPVAGAVGLVSASTLALIGWRIRRPVSARACAACAYDLMGNTSGTCPECGGVAAPGAGVRSNRPLLGLWVATLLLGLLGAAVVIPSYSSCGCVSAAEPAVHSMLKTLRSQVQLHDMENAESRFDPALGWSQLIDRAFLLLPPRNPLAANRTGITTATGADPSAGWAWVPDATGDPTTLTIRPRDEAGLVLGADSSGKPY